jgi:hypothetical protein
MCIFLFCGLRLQNTEVKMQENCKNFDKKCLAD